jgi:osmotically-inducible protein OsmY
MTVTEDALTVLLTRPDTDHVVRSGVDAVLPPDDGNAAITDGQIVDDAYFALRASGYGQLQRLQVYCDHGRVTLQGRLPTYYLKQVAQCIVLSVAGIRDIDNDVKVDCRV